MAELALVLWLIFGALAICGRAYLQYRRTGSTGLIGASGRIGSAEWLGGVVFGLAIAAGVAAPILDLAGVLDPYEDLDTATVQVAGILLYAIGLLATLAAQLAMGASWRVGVDESERTELVTDGPFAIVRNPIYSAMIPTLTGIALLNPNPVSFGAVVLLIVALEMQTRLTEEPYLLAVHGDAYAEYAARVGRFLPGIGRIAS
ncbi:MAG: methyltransferase family protein [Solirubrobacterales bacterium]